MDGAFGGRAGGSDAASGGVSTTVRTVALGLVTVTVRVPWALGVVVECGSASIFGMGTAV